MENNITKKDQELINGVDNYINQTKRDNDSKFKNLLFVIIFFLGILSLLFLYSLQIHLKTNNVFIRIAYIGSGVSLLLYIFYKSVIKKDLPSIRGWLFGSAAKGRAAYVLGLYYIIIIIICFILFWPGRK